MTAADFGEKRAFNNMLNRLEFSMMSETLLSMPPSLRIDAHNLCNIKCETCYQKFNKFSEKRFRSTFRSPLLKNINNISVFFKEEKGHYLKRAVPLSLETFQKIKMSLFPFIENVSFGAYGEPLLNKNLFVFLKECKEWGLVTHLLTNGTLLDETSIEKIVDLNIDSVSISFDGASKKVYEKIRKGARYDSVVTSIKKLNAKKGNGKPIIQLDFTASRENVDELPDLIDLSPQWGVNSILVINRYIMDFMDPHDSLFFHQDKAAESIIKARERAHAFGINFSVSSVINSILDKNYKKNVCDYPWTNVYISSSGNVHLCGCSGMKAVGNIGDSSFYEIWNGGGFKNLRRGFRGDVSLSYECKNCLIGSYITKTQNIRTFISEAHV